LNKLVNDSGRLYFIYNDTNDWLGNDYNFMFSDGHTPGLLHTIVRDTEQGTLIFASDLIPGSAWVHLPVGMGYDRSPELLCDEKKVMLDYVINQDARLFYTHDPKVVSSRVVKDEKGKYSAVDLVSQ
jgi:glyoxylase-like metal-dependent hydrolase (beta-lactamase superfamily II)